MLFYNQLPFYCSRSFRSSVSSSTVPLRKWNSCWSIENIKLRNWITEIWVKTGNEERLQLGSVLTSSVHYGQSSSCSRHEFLSESAFRSFYIFVLFSFSPLPVNSAFICSSTPSRRKEPICIFIWAITFEQRSKMFAGNIHLELVDNCLLLTFHRTLSFGLDPGEQAFEAKGEKCK